MTLPLLTVYSRPGCHLCEHLVDELLPCVRGRANVEVVDIDTQQALLKRYGVRIPVVTLDGVELCQYHLDRDALNAALAAFEAG